MAEKQRTKPIAGKGDNRRPEDFREVQNNWDAIPNFGLKPKWAKNLDKKKEKKNNFRI